MDKEKLYSFLIVDDVVKSINENLNDILKLIPELKNMIGFEHKHPHHHLDVWNHTLLALSYSPNDFDIRLVLLLHDIGKPFCYQEGEVRHYKGHANVSANMSFFILERLGFDYEYISKICYLIKMHDTYIRDEEINDDINLSFLRFKIQYCDALAHHPLKLEKRIKYLLYINDKINENDERNEYIKKITRFVI